MNPPKKEDSIFCSIVCPMFNEEEGIEPAVLKLKGLLDELPNRSEVLLINDGSTDHTLVRALQAIQSDTRFRIFSHKVNLGRGRALRTGFLEARGEIIITMEGDMSWGKDVVFRFLEAFEKDPVLDAVFASTHLPGGGYKNVPWFRRNISHWGNKVLSRLYAGGLTMTTGMTRAYRANVIKPHLLIQDEKEIHLEIAHRLLALGYKIKEIPATLSWPEQKVKKSSRGKRTNWAKIFHLVLSHLTFGIFQGLSKIIIPTILLLTFLVLFFGSWALWNLFHQWGSIFLATLTGILLIILINLIVGYVLLLHVLKSAVEQWRTQALLYFCSQGKDKSAMPSSYYDEISVTDGISGYSQH